MKIFKEKELPNLLVCLNLTGAWFSLDIKMRSSHIVAKRT